MIAHMLKVWGFRVSGLEFGVASSNGQVRKAKKRYPQVLSKG